MLQKPENDDFAIIGGHVSCLETTAETLEREFEEELHTKISVDDLDNERIDLDFCWVPLEKLRNGLKVYPLELIPYILNEHNGAVHFVSKQI